MMKILQFVKLLSQGLLSVHPNDRSSTVYPKKYAHGFCFAVLCCGYALTDFPISIRLTSLALWQSNDCPSASKATLMNMDKYFMWIHYERLHNHNKAKHNKTVCIFLGIYCTLVWAMTRHQAVLSNLLYKPHLSRQWNCWSLDIFKCIFLIKIYEFLQIFHWSLFLRVQSTISLHWLR